MQKSTDGIADSERVNTERFLMPLTTYTNNSVKNIYTDQLICEDDDPNNPNKQYPEIKEMSPKIVDKMEVQQSLKNMPLNIKMKWRKVLRRLLLLHRIICVLQNIKDLVRKDKDNKDIYVCIEDQESILRLNGPSHRTRSNIHKRCLISPDSVGAWLWMLLIIFLLIWTAIYVPYRLSFLDDVSLGVIISETIIDFIFMIDILFNFLTAYYDKENKLITDHCMIAKNYLKTWFVIDLISCFPLQLFETEQKYNKAFRLLRLPRLYKMLKFLRFMKMVNFMNSATVYKKFFFLVKLNSGVGRLIKVLLAMIFFTHLYACLWYFVAKYKNFSPDTWVYRMGLFDFDNFEKYLISFYWVLQTLTTVGYGEMPMTNKTERILALFLMIFGVGLYSYTIGNLSSLFANMDSREAKLNTKILALNEYAYNIKMPPSLYLKIISILKQNSATAYNCHFDQDSLLEELPTAIKNEVLSCTHRKILNSFSFFKDKPPQFVMDILPLFRPLSLLKDEAIYRKGDLAEEVTFLLSGRVGFITKDGYLYRNYIEGSYFGEIEMFKNQQFRTSSAITMTNIEVLRIKYYDLLKILDNYPTIKENMNNVSIQREKGNNEAKIIAKKAGFKMDREKLKCVQGLIGANHYEDLFNHKEETSSSSEAYSSSSGRSSMEFIDAETKDVVLEEIKEEEEPVSNLNSLSYKNIERPIEGSSECSMAEDSATLSEDTNIRYRHNFRAIIHSTPGFCSSTQRDNVESLKNEEESLVKDSGELNIINMNNLCGLRSESIRSKDLNENATMNEWNKRRGSKRYHKLEFPPRTFTELANSYSSINLTENKGRKSILRRMGISPLIDQGPIGSNPDINIPNNIRRRGTKDGRANCISSPFTPRIGGVGDNQINNIFQYVLVQFNKLFLINADSLRQLNSISDTIEHIHRKIGTGQHKKERGNIRW